MKRVICVREQGRDSWDVFEEILNKCQVPFLLPPPPFLFRRAARCRAAPSAYQGEWARMRVSGAIRRRAALAGACLVAGLSAAVCCVKCLSSVHVRCMPREE